MIISEPETVLMHFLRAFIHDLSRDGYDTRLTSDNEAFVATASQTDFVLSRSPDSITSVTLNSTEIYPYKDFDIDLDNQKIILKTGASVDDDVVIYYKYGESWIFPSDSMEAMRDANFPKIIVTQLVESGVPVGMFEDQDYNSLSFQIDVLSFENVLATVNSEKIEGQDICQYLSRDILKKIKEDWRVYLNTKLFNPTKLNNFRADFEPDKRLSRRIIEYNFNSFDI